MHKMTEIVMGAHCPDCTLIIIIVSGNSQKISLFLKLWTHCGKTELFIADNDLLLNYFSVVGMAMGYVSL